MLSMKTHRSGVSGTESQHTRGDKVLHSLQLRIARYFNQWLAWPGDICYFWHVDRLQLGIVFDHKSGCCTKIPLEPEKWENWNLLKQQSCATWECPGWRGLCPWLWDYPGWFPNLSGHPPLYCLWWLDLQGKWHSFFRLTTCSSLKIVDFRHGNKTIRKRSIRIANMVTVVVGVRLQSGWRKWPQSKSSEATTRANDGPLDCR